MKTTIIRASQVFTPEAELLDASGTKEFCSLLFTVTSANGFYPPSPHPIKRGLKLFCNVNIVYGNLKTFKIMPGNLNEIVLS
jgi:hypothetical protein